MKPSAKRLRILVFTLALLIVAGCTGGGAAPSTDPAPGTGSDPGAGSATDFIRNYEPGDGFDVVGITEMDTKASEKELTFGVTLPHLADEYWIASAAGVQYAADSLGIKVNLTHAGGYGNIPDQVRQIEDFIAQGVDAILVGAVDYDGPAVAVQQAFDAGIPVVGMIAYVNNDHSPAVITNDQEVGKLLADYIGENYPNAKVAMLNGPAGVSWAIARSDAFKERLAEAYPDVELLTDKYHNMERVTAGNVASDILQAHPDVEFIATMSDLQANGVVDALRAAGKNPGDIKIATLTIGPEAFEFMREGWIEHGLAERPNMQGALAVHMALKMLQGETVNRFWAPPLPGFTNDTESLDKYENEESMWNWPGDFRPN